MAKNPGKGTLLQHGVGVGPIVYTTIASRISIDGPDSSVGTVNVSDLDSTAVEKAATLPDGGKVSMEIWYDPTGATHKLLTGLQTTPSVEQWQLKFADVAGTVLPFKAILTKFKAGGMKVDDYLNASTELEITGPITWPV